MIKRSFIILLGVSYNLEKSIWKQNIHSWDDFIFAKKIKGISDKRKVYYNLFLKKAKRELYNLNSEFFTKLLPSSEHWRLYDFFKDEAVFLDIEV